MPEITPLTSGLSDSQLKLSYFFVTNKLLLRKLLVLLLIVINCALWGYSIAGLAFWALDYSRLNQQTVGLLFSPAATLPALEATKPEALQLSEPEAVGGDNGRYDLVARVFNPNANWLATFDYEFAADNSTTTLFHGFALPGSRKVLLDLGRDVSSARLEISNIKWQRITDFPELKSSHDRFAVSKDEFIAAKKPGNPSQIKFILANESPYSYWEATAVVFLYNSGNLLAVNLVAMPQLLANSSRESGLNWTRPLGDVDSWEIIPEVNYLDPSNIMPPAQY